MVWPLAPIAALINNWVELRSDAIKICVHTRRPIPHRADGIGPWLENLVCYSSFLAYIKLLTIQILYYFS